VWTAGGRLAGGAPPPVKPLRRWQLRR